jgi:hypothetical protein
MTEFEDPSSINILSNILVCVSASGFVYLMYMVIGGVFLRKMGEGKNTKYITPIFPTIVMFTVTTGHFSVFNIDRYYVLYFLIFIYLIYAMYWSHLFTKHLTDRSLIGPPYGFFTIVTAPILDIFVMFVFLLLSIGRKNLVLFRGPPEKDCTVK